MKYRIVKFQDGKDHNDNSKRDRLGALLDHTRGSPITWQPKIYESKDEALSEARKLNLAEKSYDVSWEIEEIKPN